MITPPPESAVWRMRPYRPGDEGALVRLFEDVFRRPMSEAHWRWKLKGLPAPANNVGIAVASDDTPIFQIGGIPCRYQLPGGEGTVMVAVDAMTAPEFRRKGVLRQEIGRAHV